METKADLLSYDWEAVWKKLQESDPNDGCFYLIVFDKEDDKEYRTRFLTYAEASDLITTAVAKKRLRIAATTESTHS